MCGRYTFSTPPQVVAALLQFHGEVTFPPRYNLAPTQDAPVVLADGGGRRFALMRWGLVPPWAESPVVGNRMINARAETVLAKPAFKKAMRDRRCVVPADGFFEWHAQGSGRKQPYLVHRADGRATLMAGLWETWRDRDSPAAAPLQTFTIITTSPSPALAWLHDRMPAILEPEECSRWLDPATSPDDAASLLDPAPDGVLQWHAVSARVSSPRVDTPDLVTPIEPDPPAGLFD